MEILDVRDIDFTKLEILDVLSSEGSLYYDNKLFYKFYDGMININNKEKKLMLLDEGNNNFNAIVPYVLIKNRLLTYGCAMKYVKGANSLIKYKKNDNYMLLLYDVSSSLMRIHMDPRNIVVGDLHFNNILVDKNMKHYFVDFDSCMIDNIPQDRLPNNLLTYIGNRGNFDFDVNCDTDRLCMILSFIRSLFDMDIDSIDMDAYDKISEQISTLKNLREYVVGIKNNVIGIPSLPYLHEIISLKDISGISKIRKFNNK